MYQTFRQQFYDNHCAFELAQNEARERILADLNLYLIHGLMDDSNYGKLSGPYTKFKVTKIETRTDMEFDYCKHYEVVRIHFTI